MYFIIAILYIMLCLRSFIEGCNIESKVGSLLSYFISLLSFIGFVVFLLLSFNCF